MHDLLLEVLHTALCHTIVYNTHRINDLFLDLLATHDVVVGQEVTRYGDQRLFRPALEPIHGATGDETGELEGTRAELLANLEKWGR